MSRWWLAALTVTIAVALGGCVNAGVKSTSADARVIEVTSAGMAFLPKEITVAKGQPVKLSLVNKDAVLHDFSIEQIPVTAKKSSGDAHGGHGKEPDLHVSADAGKSRMLEFTPTRPGAYTFACTVAGHKDAGMVGTLVVS